MNYVILFGAVIVIIAGIIEGLNKTKRTNPAISKIHDSNNWFLFLFIDSK